MTVTATSPWAKTIDRCQRLIAACSTFQTITSSDDATEALTRVHQAAVDEDPTADPPIREDKWPNAIVRPGAALSGTKQGTSYWNRTGNCLVAFQIQIPIDAGVVLGNFDDEERYVMNQVGEILDEMTVLAGVGTSVEGETHLNVVGYELDEGPVQLAPEEIPPDDKLNMRLPRWFVTFMVEYQA